MRLLLADGSERHIAVSDYGTAEEALRQGDGPFSGRWIATVEETLVQLSQVVEVRRVDLGPGRIEQLQRGSSE